MNSEPPGRPMWQSRTECLQIRTLGRSLPLCWFGERSADLEPQLTHTHTKKKMQDIYINILPVVYKYISSHGPLSFQLHKQTSMKCTYNERQALYTNRCDNYYGNFDSKQDQTMCEDSMPVNQWISDCGHSRYVAKWSKLSNWNMEHCIYNTQKELPIWFNFNWSQ